MKTVMAQWMARKLDNLGSEIIATAEQHVAGGAQLDRVFSMLQQPWLKRLLLSIGLVVMNTASSADLINLPEPRLQSHVAVEQALAERRTTRQYSSEPVSLTETAQLLWAAQGVTAFGGGRTAPSAGALYPLVVYLVAGDVTGLQQGVYRYEPKRHQLRLVQPGDHRRQLAKAAYSQRWMAESPAWIIYSAIEKKTTGKYGKRGIRYIYIEVGHSAQNVFLQAQALGLAAAVVGAFDDSAVQEILALPANEQPLYLQPVGRKETNSAE